MDPAFLNRNVNEGFSGGMPVSNRRRQRPLAALLLALLRATCAAWRARDLAAWPHARDLAAWPHARSVLARAWEGRVLCADARCPHAPRRPSQVARRSGTRSCSWRAWRLTWPSWMRSTRVRAWGAAPRGHAHVRLPCAAACRAAWRGVAPHPGSREQRGHAPNGPPRPPPPCRPGH